MHVNTVEELDATLAALPNSPCDRGELVFMVRRPVPLEREVVETAELCRMRGMVGDCWPTKPSKRTKDGLPHFEMQITLMNAHVIAAIAGPQENWPPAGDQLFVDLDLSEEALPIGTRFRIGEAEIEITQQEHTGCGKFHERYGSAALRWVNSKERRASRLRGVNARVIQGGEIQVGDLLCRVDSSES